MKTTFRIILTLVLFSIAMGFMESAVVIYLRKIYYPDGFHLPLKAIDFNIAIVELFREAATMIMLVTIAMIAGKNGIQRFAYFLICFGIWDIFYYVFLKVFLNWPASILDGDVLFLIPLPWFGPVLAPCLLSLTMVFVAGVLLKEEGAQRLKRIGWKNVLWMVAGSLVVISSFIMDYKNYTEAAPSTEGLNQNIAFTYNWWLFALGEAFIVWPCLIMIFKRNSTLINNQTSPA